MRVLRNVLHCISCLCCIDSVGLFHSCCPLDRFCIARMARIDHIPRYKTFIFIGPPVRHNVVDLLRRRAHRNFNVVRCKGQISYRVAWVTDVPKQRAKERPSRLVADLLILHGTCTDAAFLHASFTVIALPQNVRVHEKPKFETFIISTCMSGSVSEGNVYR